MKKSLFAVLCVVPALAHDLYLIPESFRVESGKPAVVYIHNGDEFPQSGGPPSPNRLRDVQQISSAGTKPLTAIGNEEKRGRATFQSHDGGVILTATTIPNYLELPPEKFNDYLKHEHLDAIIEWRKQHGEAAKPSRELYSKHAKSLVAGGQGSKLYAKPAGLNIEFIPAVDPFTLKAGQSLPVTLLFRGKPSANTPVEVMCARGEQLVSEQWSTTDTQGRASLKVAPRSICKLHAIRMERSDGTKADWESYWASLTFETP